MANKIDNTACPRIKAFNNNYSKMDTVSCIYIKTVTFMITSSYYPVLDYVKTRENRIQQ